MSKLISQYEMLQQIVLNLRAAGVDLPEEVEDEILQLASNLWDEMTDEERDQLERLNRQRSKLST